MMNTFKKALLLGLFVMVGSQVTFAKIKVDPKLPTYKKTSGVAGNLNSIGSDTLNNLMTYWGETFRKKYPNVNIQIEGKGSSTAPPALVGGTAQLGPMSRAMKAKEIEAFEKKYGYKPTKIAVALDSLAVYVNKDNPIDRLTLKQVDSIFSKTLKGGANKEARKWGDVGLKAKFKNLPISTYGRNSASGTYAYFKKKALYKGDFKATVKEQPGSASVVLGVTEDLGGVGYSGIGYKTSGIKAIGLSKKGKKYYKPTYKNVLSGKYPLGRQLYVYVAKKPNRPLPKLTREFLKFVLSKEGQQIVLKDGYLPLPNKASKKQLKLLK